MTRITSKGIEQFITNLKALGIIAKPNDIISALGKVYASKDCQSYDAASVQNMVDILRTEILKIYRNAEFLIEDNCIDELEVVLKSMTDVLIKEYYMGINITRVLASLSDTPYMTSVDKLKAVIDRFVTNPDVCETFTQFAEYSRANESDAEGIKDELELEYRCALLDHFKLGLLIPDEIVNDPYDTHTVCFDAIDAYDASGLITEGDKHWIELVAADKFYVEGDVKALYKELVKQGLAKPKSLDGDTFLWEDDLVSAVAASIYFAELQRLENV